MAIQIEKLTNAELTERLESLKTGGAAWRATAAEIARREELPKARGKTAPAKVEDIKLDRKQTTDYQKLIEMVSEANGILADRARLEERTEGVYTTMTRVASHYETSEGFTKVVEKLEADIRANVNNVAVDTGCKPASNQKEGEAIRYVIPPNVRACKSKLISAFDFKIPFTSPTGELRSYNAIIGDVKKAKAEQAANTPAAKAAEGLRQAIEQQQNLLDSMMREAAKKNGEESAVALLKLAGYVFGSAVLQWDSMLEGDSDMEDMLDNAEAAYTDLSAAAREASGDEEPTTAELAAIEAEAA